MSVREQKEFTVSLLPEVGTDNVTVSWTFGTQRSGSEPAIVDASAARGILRDLRERRHEMSAVDGQARTPNQREELFRKAENLRGRMGTALSWIVFPLESPRPLRRIIEELDHEHDVRIQIDCTGELETFPWELVRWPEPVPERDSFLALCEGISIVRLGNRDDRDPDKDTSPSMTWLFVDALGRSDQDDEGSLDRCGLRGNRAVTVLEDRPNWFEASEILRQRPVTIFHFSGHGSPGTPGGPGVDNGEVPPTLIFQSSDESDSPTSPNTVGAVLSERSVQLAVIAACYAGIDDNWSGFGARLIRAGVPAVVSMSAPVESLAADDFSRVLYESLATGLSLDAAVRRGRQALVELQMNAAGAPGPSLADWWLPVLHTRGGPTRFASSALVAGRREVGSTLTHLRRDRAVPVGTRSDLDDLIPQPWPSTSTRGFVLAADGSTLASWGDHLRLGACSGTGGRVRWSSPVALEHHVGARALAVRQRFVVTEILLTGAGGTSLLSIDGRGRVVERETSPERATAGAAVGGGFVWVDTTGGAHRFGVPDERFVPDAGASAFDLATGGAPAGPRVTLAAWIRNGQLVVLRQEGDGRPERRSVPVGAVDRSVIVARPPAGEVPDTVLVEDEEHYVGWAWNDLDGGGRD